MKIFSLVYLLSKGQIFSLNKPLTMRKAQEINPSYNINLIIFYGTLAQWGVVAPRRKSKIQASSRNTVLEVRR
jgi:hypothetical protein